MIEPQDNYLAEDNFDSKSNLRRRPVYEKVTNDRRQ